MQRPLLLSCRGDLSLLILSPRPPPPSPQLSCRGDLSLLILSPRPPPPNSAVVLTSISAPPPFLLICRADRPADAQSLPPHPPTPALPGFGGTVPAPAGQSVGCLGYVLREEAVGRADTSGTRLRGVTNPTPRIGLRHPSINNCCRDRLRHGCPISASCLVTVRLGVQICGNKVVTTNVQTT